jgi:hypothetical protein
MERHGWYCQFLEEDLQTSLQRTLNFATSDRCPYVHRGSGYGSSTWSMTMTSTEAFVDFKIRPSCSWNAEERPGGAFSRGEGGGDEPRN